MLAAAVAAGGIGVAGALVAALNTAAALIASNHVTGVPTSVLDYMPVSQAGLFMAAGLMTATALARVSALRCDKAALVRGATGLLAAAVIGLHFANFFHSGIAKLSLDGRVTSWLLGNDVSNRYLAALDDGVLPLAGWPEFTRWLYLQLHAQHVAGNFAVVAVQLAALIAVADPRGIILLYLVLKALHVGIYVTSGANFWPWLGLNLTIARAAQCFRSQGFTALHGAIAAAMIVFAPFFFYVAKLA